MRSALRDKIVGITHDNDRLWQIEGNEGGGVLTEYNDELTGYCLDIQKLFGANIVHYGGNAYYILLEAGRRGYQVTHIEDRR